MLPFRNGRARRALFFGLIGASFLVGPADFAQQSKKHGGKKNKDQETPAQSATPSPGELNITTYTEDNQIDLQIAMADSVLDLNTRVLSSPQRTTIKRADFEIVGDTARFDTAARLGTITGNVKMVITDQSKLRPQKSP